MACVNGPIPDDFMTDISKRLNSHKFDKSTLHLEVLDQLLLPHSKEYITINGAEDAYHVIKTMKVRGAPLIAVVGTLGLLIEISKRTFDSLEEAQHFYEEKRNYLISSRPTAVNLRNAFKDLDVEIEQRQAKEVAQFVECLKLRILAIYEDEREENRRLVWNGYQELLSLCKRKNKQKLNIMTVCNTGSLATCSWGTALGVINAMHQAGRVDTVYALETRPYNQGVRLTATELLEAGVNFRLITDNMAAWTMKEKGVDAVIAGADQVTLNGDTANKIGTYMLAVLAKYHNVAMYIAVPFTSINANRVSGDDITIEERPAQELLIVNGKYVGPESTPVWNPAFDVTPGELITKFITEFGNFESPELASAVQKSRN